MPWSRPGRQIVRIDAALETVARIAGDAELAARLGDVCGIPKRGFHQNVGGGLVAAGVFAAHDAADGFHAVFVGDHHHVTVETIGLAVQRQKFVILAATPDREIALDLGRVEDVQRAAPIEGDVIGDIHQRVDGPETDGDQPLLQPLGRGAVFHAAHQPHGKGGAKFRRAGKVQIDANRTCAFALDRRRAVFLQLAEAGSRQIAGDTVHAGAVRPVRRQSDLDDRIVQPGVIDIRCAHRCILGQFDDAAVFVGKFKFALRTHHAAAFHVADLADGERRVDAGHIVARPSQYADEAGAGVGRAADDLQLFARAGIDGEHA